MTETTAPPMLSERQYEVARAKAIVEANEQAEKDADDFEPDRSPRPPAISWKGVSDEQQVELRSAWNRVYTARFAELIAQRIAVLRSDAEALEAGATEYLGVFQQ